MKETKRVASFSLTEKGYQDLLALEKKTKKSRKDVVSSAISAAKGHAMEQPVITFRLPDAEELMFLRNEILHLECSADDIIKAIFGVRPKEKEQAKELAEIIVRLRDHIASLKVADNILKNKQHLLKELTVSDYKKIPALIKTVEQYIEASKGKTDQTKRLSRFELLLKILLIVRGSDEPRDKIS